MNPTPAQLAAAGLVALTNQSDMETALKNGHVLRRFDGAHFPEELLIYTSKDWKNGPPTPPVPVPVPPSPTNYTVSYSAPGVVIPSLSVASGSTFVVHSAPGALPGQVFQSWGDGQHTYAPGANYTMPANNVTFIAIFGTAPTPTPTPTPVPPTPGPSTTHPSGFDPPAVEAGFTRAAFDDFTSTSWSNIWAMPPYNSVSKAAQDGIFLTSHAVLKGDSLLRMECYPDPQGALNGWQITPALIAAVNGWACAGVQTARRWPVGTTITWAGWWDTYPGITAINLLMSDGWTSEIDLIEANASAKGGPVNQYAVTLMTNQGSNKVQLKANTGQDFSQKHVWQAKWTLQGTTITCDGTVVASSGFVNNAPQFWTIQPQTGDPSNPPADASITAANPITQYLDWVCFDTPG